MPNSTEILNDVENPEGSSSLPLLSILRILWKHRWLACTLWVLGSLASFFVVRMLPPVYRAEAVVLVDSQKIPTNFVSPTVGGNVPDRLALITQNIMTSARLLKIINTYGLYRQQRRGLTEDELLRRMRDDISVSFEKSWTGDRENVFHVAYEGRSPQIVAEVANRLAGLYVAENAHARERQAANTVAFLDRQLHDAKASLDEQEQRVARFKEEHNGTLPEQQSSLLGDLNSLSVQLQGTQQSIDRAQENKFLLETALSSAESAQETMSANLRASGGSESVPKLKSEILKEQLRKLRLQYTPNYPAVRTLKQEIAEAEREEAAGLGVGSPSARTGARKDLKITPPELVQSRERIATLRAQIDVAKRALESLENDRARVLKAIADCKARIAQLPLVEQEMASIKRNYDESEANYNSLLQKKLAAGVASDMERSQESEQFTVIDPARPPDKQVKSKRSMLAIGGSLGSLALGLLVGLGLEFRKRTLLGEWELPKGTVVLGRVPLIDMAVSISARSKV